MKPVKVIGSGEIAKLFFGLVNKVDTIVFASGVSDSIGCLKKDFNRERCLLLSTIRDNPSAQIIYFSSCALSGVASERSSYYRHKIEMEILVKTNAKSFLIFRLPQVFGLFHPRKVTLINYFINSILNEDNIRINTLAERYILHTDELYIIVEKIISGNADNLVMDIGNPRKYMVSEIINECEMALKKDARLSHFEAQDSYDINFALMREYFSDSAIDEMFQKNYLSYKLSVFLSSVSSLSQSNN